MNLSIITHNVDAWKHGVLQDLCWSDVLCLEVCSASVRSACCENWDWNAVYKEHFGEPATIAEYLAPKARFQLEHFLRLVPGLRGAGIKFCTEVVFQRLRSRGCAPEVVFRRKVPCGRIRTYTSFRSTSMYHLLCTRTRGAWVRK